MTKQGIVFMVIGALLLMGASAAVAWFTKPEPLPEQLPPKVIRETIVKEIKTENPQDKVVQQIDATTEGREVPEVICDPEATEIRNNVQADQYISEEGSGWKGVVNTEVKVRGEWVLALQSPFDLKNSETRRASDFGYQPQKKHKLMVGYGIDSYGDPVYFAAYERKTDWHAPRWASWSDPVIPDSWGVFLIDNNYGASTGVFIGWEF